MNESVRKWDDFRDFPAYYGQIVFPISIAKITSDMNPENMFGFIRWAFEKVKVYYEISGVFLYTGSLYARYGLSAKRDNESLMNQHMNLSKRILDQDNSGILMKDAYMFLDWDYALRSYRKLIEQSKNQLLQAYREDTEFQQTVVYDIGHMLKKEVDEHTVHFLLEEIATTCLLTKKYIILDHPFTSKKNTWTLICYWGPPPMSLAYVYQKNLLGLKESKNPFQNAFYNAKQKELYDFNQVDLSSKRVA